MDLNDLHYFALIVQHGGFSAAERHVHITKSKLSRRVQLLEERMGVRLLQRNTRKVTLTEAGRVFYEHCAAMVAEAEEARHAVEHLRSEPAGTVRVCSPTMMAQFFVTRLAAEFMLRYPKVRVELESTDRIVNLIDERFDVALRPRSVGFDDTGLISRQLAAGRWILVASPAYLKDRAPIEEPMQLAGLDTIGSLREGPEQFWSFVGSDDRTVCVPLWPRLLCSELTLAYQAAVCGVGVAFLPHRIVRRGLQDGSLQHVAKNWATPELVIHLVYVSRRGMLPSVRALINFFVERMPTALME
jgi:DNA-binding transcriptional LysR family regulator